MHERLLLDRNVCRLYTLYCESSISLEGGRSKDRVMTMLSFQSFQEFPHQKLFFDLKIKTTRKQR